MINNKISTKLMRHLDEVGYFERPSAAAMSIMPYVEPEFVGLEIGVYGGLSSRLFLDFCHFMYFIDPCTPYAENPDKEWFTVEKDFLKTMEPYNGRFTFIKGFSADVADQIPELDFVFIDGNHEYEFVKKDIELYWPKVKPGGFLSGHDYSGGHPQVTKAVDEFIMQNGLPLQTPAYSWLVRKPIKYGI